MKIANSVRRLDQNQKSALHAILTKMQNGKVLSQSDVGLLGMDVHHCPASFVQKTLGVSRPTMTRMAKQGVPRNHDESYDLPLVFKWYIEREIERVRPSAADPKREQEVKRLENQNKILEAKYDEMMKSSLSRDQVETVANQQAMELRRYWTDAWKRNINILLKALSVPPDRGSEVMEVIDDFIRQAMDAFLETGKELKI